MLLLSVPALIWGWDIVNRGPPSLGLTEPEIGSLWERHKDVDPNPAPLVGVWPLISMEEGWATKSRVRIFIGQKVVIAGNGLFAGHWLVMAIVRMDAIKAPILELNYTGKPPHGPLPRIQWQTQHLLPQPLLTWVILTYKSGAQWDSSQEGYWIKSKEHLSIHKYILS